MLDIKKVPDGSELVLCASSVRIYKDISSARASRPYTIQVIDSSSTHEIYLDKPALKLLKNIFEKINLDE